MKKIWIDLDNSPHVLFFNPIIKELENRGYKVVITSRNYAQVTDLADLFGIKHKRIGKHYGKNKLMKLVGLLVRVFQMIPFYLKEKPDLVFSHGSRSMHIVAKIFGVKLIGATDYEHTQHLPFIMPDVMILPDVLPDEAVKGFAKRIARYPGIKEDVYVPEFNPNPDALKSLPVTEENIIVSIRPPATMAHYHTQKSDDLFEGVLNYLMSIASVKVIIVPRTDYQKEEIKIQWKEFVDKNKIIIPEQVLNGLDLIWHSDLVISGGGTMIREAAALGVPAYSTFGGKTGAVDKYLEESGRLVMIRSVEEIRSKIKIEKRKKDLNRSHTTNNTLKTIVDEVESEMSVRKKN